MLARPRGHATVARFPDARSGLLPALAEPNRYRILDGYVRDAELFADNAAAGLGL
jgi:hypothetical protein